MPQALSRLHDANKSGIHLELPRLGHALGCGRPLFARFPELELVHPNAQLLGPEGRVERELVLVLHTASKRSFGPGVGFALRSRCHAAVL